ncbi:hypothetical protein CR152_31130 [Massilia violaceinigra]|uniref:Uncharacterized protein n=1 Tax=Massilia violaceinigra TaxID=2045208 RepID=A0A2D2DU13_9BURK|nr:hypothetical protein [Massilia violaceinigra]ATQ78474.1 hypothetical protein CR152_31130 [Massilia violaceinigra]
MTAIEYMHIDPAYCRHVPGLATARETGDVRLIGAHLQGIDAGEAGLYVATLKTPLLARAPPAQPMPAPAAAEAPRRAAAAQSAPAAALQSDVGRLR